MRRELQRGDPELIGPYRVRGLLGVGGMGRVYQGVSPGGRLVAVKVIRSDLAADAEFRTRFQREIAVARKVSGQFTAPVIDADLDGPVPWLATAYVAGPSLADAVAEHGPLPVGSVLELAAGLAEALNAIHAAGVVHRDLKPANVLLAGDGPRVIDFGISLGAEASALTRTGLVVGSPGFMSPEQAEGREVGPSSDIFSLGAVLAFAATGKGPFGSGSTPALVYRVVHSPAGLDQVPAEVRPLIERCLAKDPGRRPTARDLLAEAGSAWPAVGWLPEPVTRTFLSVPTPRDAARTITSLAATPAWEAPAWEAPAREAPAHGAPAREAPTQVQPAWRGEHRRPRRRLGRPLAIASLVTGLLAASAVGGVALAASAHPSSGAHSASGQVSTPAASSSPRSAQPRTSSSSTSSAAATPPQAAVTTPTATGTATPAMSASTAPAPAASATPTAAATPTTPDTAPASAGPASAGPASAGSASAGPAASAAPAASGSAATTGSAAGPLLGTAPSANQCSNENQCSEENQCLKDWRFAWISGGGCVCG